MRAKDFFRIPTVKDDVMRIVCILLDVIVAGMYLEKSVIVRFWNCCCWYCR